MMARPKQLDDSEARRRVAARKDRVRRERLVHEKITSAAKRAAGVDRIINRVDPETVAARLAEIPADTRNLTGWMFGDPLPGRSALDRSMAR